ncbi:MAG TPA: choice-of-anchor L domain-containing protein, partial [Cryomorphaceae bacterium]|nr:choice-of-anchor L domain-containing protein [Cryomorphaceae bacterium]
MTLIKPAYMNFRIPLLSTLAILGFTFSAVAQITVDNTITAEELVLDYLIGDGVDVENITFNGQPGSEANVQIGLYQGTSNVVSFDEGIVMGTFDVLGVETGFGGAPTNPAEEDPDLVDIAGFNINDGAILEFDFLATSDSIKFNYVFASNEYPSYTCTQFNDAFGFFLSGPGINGPYIDNAENIALIPNTDIPVAINTVNGGSPTGSGQASNCEDANPNWIEDSQYFVDNGAQPAGDVQFPGLTVTLTAEADVDCGEWYHIKLAIGDAVDGALDSGVFLEAGSFAAFGEVMVDVTPTIGGAPIINPDYDDVLVAGCSEATFDIIR